MATRTRPPLGTLCIGVVLSSASGCGGEMPLLSQEAAMDSTFAGKNKCQAQAHDRPFVVEWDATDIATFESRAARDVVFVRYQGCELEVVDACADDSVPGRFGSYAPPRWTSGSIERVNIDDSADLHAKLPLGVATLGGKVARGVKLELQYFVSGVATATRSVMYRGALRHNPSCQRATHFVYAYNLGAFALYAKEKAEEGVGAEVAGVDVGVDSRRERASEKRSGKLSACEGKTAADSDSCRVPIRLALRTIEQGEGPVRGDDAPTPPEPSGAESKLAVAAKLRQAAMQKALSGDGRGCLADLAQADELDPDPTRSSASGLGQGHLRAQCEMIGGDCESGKVHLRKAHQESSPELPTRLLDEMVAGSAKRFCPYDTLAPWDLVGRLAGDLNLAWMGGKADACATLAARLVTALDAVGKPGEWELESTFNGGTTALAHGGECLAKAGRCVEGKKLVRESLRRRGDHEAVAEPGFTTRWDQSYPSCSGK